MHTHYIISFLKKHNNVPKQKAGALGLNTRLHNIDNLLNFHGLSCFNLK